MKTNNEWSIKHGHYKNNKPSPTYITWQSMRQRCGLTGQAKASYKHILICDRWANSFNNFLEDMGERPNGKTLDRIDNDGNYEPSNCKWSTPKEQSKNRSMPRKMKNSSSRFKSVYYVKSRKCWRAQISGGRKDKDIYLGQHQTEIEAATAVKKYMENING